MCRRRKKEGLAVRVERVGSFKYAQTSVQNVFTLLLHCSVSLLICVWYFVLFHFDVYFFRGLKYARTKHVALRVMRKIFWILTRVFHTNYPISDWFFRLFGQSFTQVHGFRANLALFRAFNFTFHSEIELKTKLARKTELWTRLYTNSTEIETTTVVEKYPFFAAAFSPFSRPISCVHAQSRWLFYHRVSHTLVAAQCATLSSVVETAKAISKQTEKIIACRQQTSQPAWCGPGRVV